MSEEIQNTEPEARGIWRWASYTMVVSFVILAFVLRRWLSEPWAVSLAWLVSLGGLWLFLIITQPKFKTRRPVLLWGGIWLAGAVLLPLYGLVRDRVRGGYSIAWTLCVLLITFIFVQYIRRKQRRQLYQNH